MAQPVLGPTKATVHETGNPEREATALQEMVNAPLLPPVEGRAENLLFFHKEFIYVLPLPKISAEEQFPQFLGYKGCGLTERRNAWPLSPPLLLPTGRSLRFKDASLSHISPATPSQEPWIQEQVLMVVRTWFPELMLLTPALPWRILLRSDLFY